MACAGEQGTHPHDASASEHQAMAEREDRAAEAHEGPEKKAAGPRASGPSAGVESQATSSAQCGRGECWTSATTPTEQHKQDAKRHRELAAKHRAASAALLAAEEQACTGISEDDRDISPFYHREDIISVSVLEEPIKGLGRQPVMKTTGAKIEFRAVPGMTAEWLQRVVECHIARASAAGHNMPEMDYCPLVPKGVKASVSSTGNGFSVDVTSGDAATVKEIIRRAQALKK
jgi:hypothetical protein